MKPLTQILAVVGLLALLLLGIGSCSLFLDGRSDRAPTVVVGDDSGTAAEDPAVTSRIRSFRRVEGTRYLRAALASRHDPGGLSGKGYREIERNHLYYDLDSGRTHWLFPGKRQWIVAEHRLTTVEADTGRREGPPALIVYEVVRRDGDGDGDLDRDDGTDLLFSDPTGRTVVDLADDTGDVLGVYRIDDRRAVVLYEQGDRVLAAEIDLDTFEATTRRELPRSTRP